MSTKELTIAASTVWVVLAAVLVMFMQAGFAFLEAGLTRMKNVGHIAAKNVLVLAIASIVYYLVGFGIAFGDGGNGIVGGSGFVPSVDELLSVGAAPFSWFSDIPGAAGYMFEVVFAAVSLAIVWGAMAERTKLWVYFAFGAVFTLIYSVTSHWIWSPDGWLFAKGMQDFAGSTVVHYQGALAGLAGAILLGPRLGKFGPDRKPNAIPGHNMAYTTLGVLILWFGWFGFNPGSTLTVGHGNAADGFVGGGVGFFSYVALNTNIAAAAGVLGAIVTSWLVVKKPDLSMMLNGAIAALVAITASCAFVAPWAAIVIGFVSGIIVVVGSLAVERVGLDDPVGAIAAHGMSGVWGTLALGFLTVPGLADRLGDRSGRAVLRRRAAPARDSGAGARLGRRVHVYGFVPRAVAVQGHLRHPHRPRGRAAGTRRVRARNVGLSGVLHPGAGRVRHGCTARLARPHRRQRSGRPRDGHDGAHRLRREASRGSATGPLDPPLTQRHVCGKGQGHRIRALAADVAQGIGKPTATRSPG